MFIILHKRIVAARIGLSIQVIISHFFALSSLYLLMALGCRRCAPAQLFSPTRHACENVRVQFGCRLSVSTFAASLLVVVSVLTTSAYGWLCLCMNVHVVRMLLAMFLFKCRTRRDDISVWVAWLRVASRTQLPNGETPVHTTYYAI